MMWPQKDEMINKPPPFPEMILTIIKIYFYNSKHLMQTVEKAICFLLSMLLYFIRKCNWCRRSIKIQLFQNTTTFLQPHKNWSLTKKKILFYIFCHSIQHLKHFTALKALKKEHKFCSIKIFRFYKVIIFLTVGLFIYSMKIHPAV